VLGQGEKVRILIILILQAISGMSSAEENFDFQKYLDASLDGLKLQTETHQRIWGIGESDRWNVDQDEGLIWWTFSDGKVASASVQIIGTYNRDDGSFLWAWDHPSIDPALRKHAMLVQSFGEEHQIDKLTTRTVYVTESEAWEFVALANRLADANGGYRADAGGPLIFMTYGEIKLEKQAP
jgi:hypothetical protein